MTEAQRRSVTGLIGWLRGSRTRRMMARALGGGERPSETYLRMATRILDKVATEVAEKPWTDLALPAEQPAAGLCRYCGTEITDPERLCPSRGFSLWCVPAQPAQPAEAALREALVETLGSLHNIEARAHMIVRWIDDPNLHPVEEAQAIQRFRLEAHERIAAALAAQPTPPEETA